MSARLTAAARALALVALGAVVGAVLVWYVAPREPLPTLDDAGEAGESPEAGEAEAWCEAGRGKMFGSRCWLPW